MFVSLDWFKISLLRGDVWTTQDNVGVLGIWYSSGGGGGVSPSLLTSVIPLLWDYWNFTVFGHLHIPGAQESCGSRCSSLYCSCEEASQKGWKEWSLQEKLTQMRVNWECGSLWSLNKPLSQQKECYTFLGNWEETLHRSIQPFKHLTNQHLTADRRMLMGTKGVFLEWPIPKKISDLQ